MISYLRALILPGELGLYATPAHFIVDATAVPLTAPCIFATSVALSARGATRASFSKTALLTMARMSGTPDRVYSVAPNVRSDDEAIASMVMMMAAQCGASQFMGES